MCGVHTCTSNTHVMHMYTLMITLPEHQTICMCIYSAVLVLMLNNILMQLQLLLYMYTAHTVSHDYG